MKKINAMCLVFLMTAANLAQAQAKAPAVPRSSSERIAELEKRVQTQSEMIGMLFQHYTAQTAGLDCASHRFSEIRLAGSALILFVACSDVQPYLEGHRVKLRIGNPYSFDMDGIKGNLWYGTTILEAYQKHSKVDLVSTQKLRSGSWVSLEVVINPSKPSQLRELTVGDLAIDTIAGVVEVPAGSR